MKWTNIYVWCDNWICNNLNRPQAAEILKKKKVKYKLFFHPQLSVPMEGNGPLWFWFEFLWLNIALDLRTISREDIGAGYDE